MKWSDLVNPSRVDEMTRPTLADAMQRLGQAGYRKAGAGAYGAVFVKPGRDSVLKLFSTRDKPAIEYYKLIQNNQSNPYFPKLRGPAVRINNDYMAIQLEELKKLPMNYKTANFVSAVNGLVQMGITSTPSKTAPVDAMKEILADAQAKVALNLIVNLIRSNGWTADIKDDNIMQRSDGHYVFTDPIYVGSDAFMNNPEVAPDGRFKTYSTESEQLDEVTRPSLKQAENRLLSAGWIMLGNGHFGRTYYHPYRNDVLKLYAATDTGYTDFLDYIREFPSPYFPKLIGPPTKITPAYNAVRLEFLHVTSFDFPFDGVDVINGLKRGNMSGNASPEAIEDFERRYPGFIKTVQHLVKYGRSQGHNIDFGVGHNLMFRNDGTPVLIDPFAGDVASLSSGNNDEFELMIRKRGRKGPVDKMPPIKKRDPQKVLPMNIPRMRVPFDQRNVIGESKKGLFDMADSYTDLAGRLREQNYRKLDDLELAKVWRKNNSVLVVVDIRDTASLEYVEFCKTTTNQHVPVIGEGPKKVAPHHRMYSTRAFDRITDVMWNRLKPFENFVDYKKNPGSYPDVEDARKAYPNVYVLLERLHQKGMFRKYDFDLGRSVWREYNGRPILVNPFATKTVHRFREALNEKFFNDLLGGGWITPTGQYIPVDHEQDIHHTDIAIRALDDIPNEHLEDYHSSGEAQSPQIIHHALTKGWIRVSTWGDKEFNVNYEPNTVSKAANDALCRLISRGMNYQTYLFFNSYDGNAQSFSTKRLATLHTRRDVV